MARLILHSDDFGLHSEVNRGILEAARRGALTSASVMTNGAAAEEAFEEARRLPELGVGVHLNIVRGRPLCDPESVPSLVDGSGRFFNSVATLLHKSLLGRLSLDEVHREYRQQVLRALEHGITPTHFDGEKHTHLLLPEAVSALRRLSAEFGIRKVRTIAEAPVLRALSARGFPVPGSFTQRLKLQILEYRSRSARAAWSDLKTPDGFFGVLMSGQEDLAHGAEWLRALLGLESSMTVEWMFHLGHPFDLAEPAFQQEFGRFFLSEARTRELEFLCSTEVAAELERRRAQLISYREL